ncbi:hypothetical protein [Sedimentisphaera cyanobacteriorum]|nr:hypothetical protein [Sedimentisphaera cyanobacteriorum]
MQSRDIISSLARFFVIGFVIIPIIISIFMSVYHSGTSTDSNGNHATSSARVPKTPKIDKSEKMQADRLNLIERLQREGIFGDIIPRSSGATIVVKPAFYTLDFKDKQSFVSVVYAYYFDGLTPYTPILLRDSRTNNNIGSFTVELGLDIK